MGAQTPPVEKRRWRQQLPAVSGKTCTGLALGASAAEASQKRRCPWRTAAPGRGRSLQNKQTACIHGGEMRFDLHVLPLSTHVLSRFFHVHQQGLVDDGAAGFLSVSMW